MNFFIILYIIYRFFISWWKFYFEHKVFFYEIKYTNNLIHVIVDFHIYTIICYNLLTFMLCYYLYLSTNWFILKNPSYFNWNSKLISKTCSIYIYISHIYFIFKYIINICMLINHFIILNYTSRGFQHQYFVIWFQMTQFASGSVPRVYYL